MSEKRSDRELPEEPKGSPHVAISVHFLAIKAQLLDIASDAQHWVESVDPSPAGDEIRARLLGVAKQTRTLSHAYADLASAYIDWTLATNQRDQN